MPSHGSNGSQAWLSLLKLCTILTSSLHDRLGRPNSLVCVVTLQNWSKVVLIYKTIGINWINSQWLDKSGVQINYMYINIYTYIYRTDVMWRGDVEGWCEGWCGGVMCGLIWRDDVEGWCEGVMRGLMWRGDVGLIWRGDVGVDM